MLLKGAPGAPHGFEAKVADFGLARDFSIVSRLGTRTYGTMSHVAPEVLASDALSKASDVYSFGVILWELYTGQRAWAGLNFAQVGARHAAFRQGVLSNFAACVRPGGFSAQMIHLVAVQNKGLQPPEGAPLQLARLMRLCMAQDPAERPTFEALIPDLKRISTKPAGTRMGGLLRDQSLN